MEVWAQQERERRKGRKKDAKPKREDPSLGFNKSALHRHTTLRNTPPKHQRKVKRRRRSPTKKPTEGSLSKSTSVASITLWSKQLDE